MKFLAETCTVCDAPRLPPPPWCLENITGAGVLHRPAGLTAKPGVMFHRSTADIWESVMKLRAKWFMGPFCLHSHPSPEKKTTEREELAGGKNTVSLFQPWGTYFTEQSRTFRVHLAAFHNTSWTEAEQRCCGEFAERERETNYISGIILIIHPLVLTYNGSNKYTHQYINIKHK